jgi:hypothetical protein
MAARPHRIAKTGARRQLILIEWVLQQVPLVEAEVKQGKAAEDSLKFQIPGRSNGLDNAASSRQAQTQSEDRPSSPATGREVSPPAPSSNSLKQPRVEDTGDDGRRSRRVSKNLHSGTTKNATSGAQLVANNATRSSASSSTPAHTTSSAPGLKRTTPVPVASTTLDVAPRRSRRLAGKQPEFDMLKSKPRGATASEEPAGRPSGSQK